MTYAGPRLTYARASAQATSRRGARAPSTKSRAIRHKSCVLHFAAMKRTSAGLLMHRTKGGQLEVLLVHPGGPLWDGRDEGVWSIPKGEIELGENPLEAAIREFVEETGVQPSAPYRALGSVRQKSGKIVHAWAFEGDCDSSNIHSHTFELEWPPRSGRMEAFPEVDRAGFFDPATANVKINPAQRAFVEELVAQLAGSRTRHGVD